MRITIKSIHKREEVYSVRSFTNSDCFAIAKKVQCKHCLEHNLSIYSVADMFFECRYVFVIQGLILVSSDAT